MTIVNCIPGGRETDIETNLKVLAKGKSTFSRIVIQVGANNVRMTQLEITMLTIKLVGPPTTWGILTIGMLFGGRPA